MKRLLSKSVVLGVVALLTAAFGAAPAGAAAVGAAQLSGSLSADVIGYYQANPTQVGTVSIPVDVSMSGLAAGVVGTGAATCAISYTSTGTTTLATGAGSSGLNCNGSFVGGGTVSESCSASYTQTGGYVAVTGSCTGTVNGSLSANCAIQVVPPLAINAECEFSII